MFSDALGYWRTLDVLNVTGDWQKLRSEATWANDTFRITCESNPRLTVGFVWIRQTFATGAVTPAIRYYPKVEPQIVELPIPQELFDRGVTQRAIEVSRSLPRRVGFTLVANPITLKIEELAGR